MSLVSGREPKDASEFLTTPRLGPIIYVIVTLKIRKIRETLCE